MTNAAEASTLRMLFVLAPPTESQRVLRGSTSASTQSEWVWLPVSVTRVPKLAQEAGTIMIDPQIADHQIPPSELIGIPDDTRPILVQQQVCAGIRFEMTGLWNVTFTSFDKWIQDMKSSSFDVDNWATSHHSKYDLVFCAADLSDNLLDTKYGLAPIGVETYVSHLKALEIHVPFFPPVKELIASGYKFKVVSDLDHVAKHITDTHRPSSVLATSNIIPERHVRKREHSHRMQHVLFGPQTIPITSQGKGTSKGDVYPGATVPNGLRWFDQEYVKPLREGGELFVFTVGEYLHHIVATYPDQSSGAPQMLVIQHPPPFKVISQRAYSPSPRRLFITDTFSLPDTQAAYQDLFNFIEKTSLALIIRECIHLSYSQIQDHSLYTLGRFDVSVIPVTSQAIGTQLHWFVNGVSRGFVDIFPAINKQVAFSFYDTLAVKLSEFVHHKKGNTS